MKALVVYGTRWGGTVGVAEKIGDSLREADYTVDVVDARRNPSKVDLYDLVVVGSGIRAVAGLRKRCISLRKTLRYLGLRKQLCLLAAKWLIGEKRKLGKRLKESIW
jgi:hypothetical protein